MPAIAPARTSAIRPRPRIARGRPVAALGLALLCLAGLLALSLARAQAARAQTLAVDPLGASAPVLWNGGAAWEDAEGVSAATPASPARRLLSYKPLGYSYSFALDSGSGASAAASGMLAFGWEEANNETPPMGPGDTNVPAPPLPYESSITHRGTIAADGQVAQLPACGARAASGLLSSYRVSLAGESAAYLCSGVAPGAPPPPASEISPAYVAVSDLATPAAAPQTFGEAGGAFQISGGYLAYYAGDALQAGHVVVAERATGTTISSVPTQADEVPEIALQDDGTLVLLHAGSSTCTPEGSASPDAYPAEWFAPGSTTAHQLGCFYDGARRPVDGRWVALAPAPGGLASLELVTLAGGATRTLALFANPGMFEPQQTPLLAGADFDGQRLAFVQATCTGSAVQFVADIESMSPGAPAPARCPAELHVPARLRAGRGGVVHVAVSCPLGCTLVQVSIAQPRAFADEGGYVSVAPSKPKVVSFRLGRRQLAELRRRRHVPVTITALSSSLGNGRPSKVAAHVQLSP